MTTAIEMTLDRSHYAWQAGGWISFCAPQPGIPVATSCSHLSAVEARPGNLRYATDGDLTLLLGELRDPDGMLTAPMVHQRLFGQRETAVSAIGGDEVACLLDETEHDWTQKDEAPTQWSASTRDRSGHPCLLTATPKAGGIEVSCIAAEWTDELCEPSRSAIERFLTTAHRHVRFARFRLNDDRALAISLAAFDRLEIELIDSVNATLAACRLVRAEVAALTSVGLAGAYLNATT